MRKVSNGAHTQNVIIIAQSHVLLKGYVILINQQLLIMVLFVLPHTDLTLTTERLVELFASMDDGYVDTMGGYLETPYSKSEEFEMNYQNPAQRKEAYLDYYVHNHPAASWTMIAQAFHVFGLPQQAAVVKNTYIQGTLYDLCIHI